MRCRLRTPKAGEVLPVNQSYHYPLPSGLAPGSMAKLISFESGYWTIEANGQTFEVFMARIESGFEYEVRGRWYPADDPRVQARRHTEALANSPAYSGANPPA